MELILEEDIVYKTKINDFGVEPVNKRIITTGQKLIYYRNKKFEKESGGKVKNCEIIKYIKEKNFYIFVGKKEVKKKSLQIENNF